MMERGSIFVLMVVVASTVVSQAAGAIPESGTFDIVIDPPETEGLSFEPTPWFSPSSLETMYLYPFASDDLYAGPGTTYNLAEAQFADGNINITDYGTIEGDLGIRIVNMSGATQTFEATLLTLDFVENSLAVYLPEFTFDWQDDMFFWVAESGATYYANSSKGAGYPDMFAADTMAAGDEYLARVPEPATLILFGLGGLILRQARGQVLRRRK